MPCNKVHTSISPEGLSKRLRTKVNVNLGTSKDVTDYDSGIMRYSLLMIMLNLPWPCMQMVLLLVKMTWLLIQCGELWDLTC
ncbi:hypothetical protein [uncultured Veillonella sp.]|uniref:hypothetical protein n=1 Tax=uncultured Veillonella sp. TaxID=159268 RepID=UPI0028D44B9E|nr:hypothetical protein [uncultured Veillonella sp.]